MSEQGKRQRHKWTGEGSEQTCAKCGMRRKGESFRGRYRDGYRFAYFKANGSPAPTHYDRQGSEATPLCVPSPTEPMGASGYLIREGR